MNMIFSQFETILNAANYYLVSKVIVMSKSDCHAGLLAVFSKGPALAASWFVVPICGILFTWSKDLTVFKHNYGLSKLHTRN